MDFSKLKIGYLPYDKDFKKPGDKRRFVYYAKKRGIDFLNVELLEKMVQLSVYGDRWGDKIKLRRWQFIAI